MKNCKAEWCALWPWTRFTTYNAQNLVF